MQKAKNAVGVIGGEAVGKDRKLFLMFWMFLYLLSPIVSLILKYS